MQLRQKIVSLAAGVLSLPLIELVLSGLGIGLRYRIVVAALGIGAAGLAGARLFSGTLSDLRTIRSAID